MKYMVPLEEAQQLLLQHVKPLEPVELDLLQALGMVLAVDVPAPEPVPRLHAPAWTGCTQIL